MDTVKVKREIEVYQWIETEKEHDDRKTYTYSKEWKGDYISMDNYHHRENCPGVQNPPNWPCKTETFYNPAVDLGQYLMSRSQLEKWDDWKTENLQEMGAFII